MKETIRAILTDMERVRENLLSLSDDIWLSIDHNDSEALQDGVRFKLAYNEKMAAFDQVSTDLSALVQQFTDVSLDQPSAPAGEELDDEANQRLIRELDREKPHNLYEDFRYKRPYGFVLQGKAHTEIVTWRRVLELVCRRLDAYKPELMTALPDHPEFISNRGNRSFSTHPEDLRSAMMVTADLYTEANLSANSIRDVIRKMLQTFEVSETEMKIYLRQDRDADFDREGNWTPPR